jgi:pimeloyl-ACP methyl ester carboxylesterase
MTGKRRTPPGAISAGKMTDEPPRIRKTYIECRFGQLHVTTAFPVGGGFDEHPTLVCVHRCPLSSRVLRPFIEEIGRDRSVYAPDLPGCGESDPPPPKPSIADYAAALTDFLDQMRFRQVDVLGHHTGSLVAAELAIARPDVVRRLMFVGLPILSGEERAVWARSVTPLAAAADGGHLQVDWQRTIASQDPAVRLEATAEDFAIKLHNGPNFWWMPYAALGFAAGERLPLVRQPVLLVRTKDHLWDASLRARALLRDVKVLDLPANGSGIFRAAPKVIAQHLRAFLDR